MFNTLTQSRWLAKPLYLYRFVLGPLVYRFTSADRDVTIGADTYLTVPGGIEHSPIREAADSGAKEIVKITMPHLLDPGAAEYPVTQALGAHFRPYPPSGRVMVTIMAGHHGDAETQVEWMGRVVGPSFTATQLMLSCDPFSRSGDRPGARLPWQRGCGLDVYGQGRGMCNLDREAFAVPAEVDALSGLSVTAAPLADSQFPLAGGYIEITTSSGLVERRGITAHTGSTIVLHYPVIGMASGDAFVAYPACEQTYAACVARGNDENYGGALYMPVKNPMKGLGGPVW